MVFKEVVGIETETPLVAVEVEARQPAAKTVSRTTGIFVVNGIFSTRYQCPQHTFQASLLDDDFLRRTVGMETIGFSSELGGKLCSQLHREQDFIGIADLQITRLGVIECVFGIFVALVGELFLPFVVSSLAVGEMALEGQPVLCMGNGPIVRQGNSHLGDRTGVDAEGLGTGTQLLVLQLHRLFLGTYGQRTFQPTSLDKSLMHDERTGESCCHSDIEAIADAPFPAVVKRQRTRDGATHIAIRILQ